MVDGHSVGMKPSFTPLLLTIWMCCKCAQSWFVIIYLCIFTINDSASGTAPAGSPLAKGDDKDDPDLLDNDVPDLRSFPIKAMKLWVDSGPLSVAHLFWWFLLPHLFFSPPDGMKVWWPSCTLGPSVDCAVWGSHLDNLTSMVTIWTGTIGRTTTGRTQAKKFPTVVGIMAPRWALARRFTLSTWSKQNIYN